jgi:hypothetical protein
MQRLLGLLLLLLCLQLMLPRRRHQMTHALQRLHLD